MASGRNVAQVIFDDYDLKFNKTVLLHSIIVYIMQEKIISIRNFFN
jgi:hypothetical protein